MKISQHTNVVFKGSYVANIQPKTRFKANFVSTGENVKETWKEPTCH